jgi:hypothetical protein
VLADLALVAHRAVDVADLQREPNQLVSVNKRNDVVDNGHTGLSMQRRELNLIFDSHS